MDTYRGRFSDQSDDHAHASNGQGEDWPEVEFGDEDSPREAPPSPVGQDERRMQVRAYNHWASLLDNRNFPSIEDLRPDDLPDFGPHSVLLDFTAGIENPAIQFLGNELGKECGADGEIASLSDVPARSLLSRITDHYMQILANQAPIGFEAEFVNQREQTILYRGILLPFSSDDDNIDFIYGVINWKELVDQQTTDNLLQEIDQALTLNVPANSHADLPITDWADAPVGPAGEDDAGEDDGVFDLVDLAPESPADDVLELGSADEFAELAPEPADEPDCLADYLASARELAELARGSEDRTRHALYAAIGRAYDFSLAAEEAPGEFAELVEDFGLTVQDRAPMTPVVKLVFGSEYDKTRLTEYASALGHARRIGLGRGALGLIQNLSEVLANANENIAVPNKNLTGERNSRRNQNSMSPTPYVLQPGNYYDRDVQSDSPMKDEDYDTIRPTPTPRQKTPTPAPTERTITEDCRYNRRCD